MAYEDYSADENILFKADKLLEPDGSVITRGGEIVLPPNEERAMQYISMSPEADKLLQMDGSIKTRSELGGTGGKYTRPNDWIEHPIPKDEEFSILLAIFEKAKNQYSLTITSKAFTVCTFSIDWGDGLVEEFSVNGSKAVTHYYDYKFIDESTMTTRGYKQALMKIKVISGVLEGLTFYIGGYRISSMLEVKLCSKNLLSFTINGTGSPPTKYPYLESVEFIGECNIKTFSLLQCESLMKVKGFDFSKLTSAQYLFYNCCMLSEVDNIENLDLSSATSVVQAFYNCRSLRKIGITAPKATTLNDTFNGCSSLQEITKLDIPLVTQMSNTFNGCTVLQKLPAIDTSQMSNFATFINNCTSLIDAGILDCKSVVSTAYGILQFYTNNGLSKIQFKNMNANIYQLHFGQTNLSREMVLEIFESLYDRTSIASPVAKITLSSIPAMSELTAEDKAIALNKNWTIE